MHKIDIATNYSYLTRFSFDPLATVVMINGNYVSDMMYIVDNRQLFDIYEGDQDVSLGSFFVADLVTALGLPVYVFPICTNLANKYVAYYDDGRIKIKSKRILQSPQDYRAYVLNDQLRIVEISRGIDVTNHFDIELQDGVDIADYDNLVIPIHDAHTIVPGVDFQLRNIISTLTLKLDATFLVLPDNTLELEAMQLFCNDLTQQYAADSWLVFYADRHVNQNNIFSLQYLDETFVNNTYSIQLDLPYYNRRSINASYYHVAFLLAYRLLNRRVSVSTHPLNFLKKVPNRLIQEPGLELIFNNLKHYMYKHWNEYLHAGIAVLKKLVRVYLLQAVHKLDPNIVYVKLNDSVDEIRQYLDEIVTDVRVYDPQFYPELNLVTIPMLVVFEIYNRIFRVVLNIRLDPYELNINETVLLQ